MGGRLPGDIRFGEERVLPHVGHPDRSSGARHVGTTPPRRLKAVVLPEVARFWFPQRNGAGRVPASPGCVVDPDFGGHASRGIELTPDPAPGGFRLLAGQAIRRDDRNPDARRRKWLELPILRDRFPVGALVGRSG